MNINQLLLLKVQRFNHKYGILFKKCMHIMFQNWELNLINPAKEHAVVISTEEALSNIYQNNQLLLLTENEILHLISIGLNDVNHVSCQKAQEWFDNNFDRFIYSYYCDELAKVMKQQMINNEITIYNVNLLVELPINETFPNIHYNKEGMDFAKSLK